MTANLLKVSDSKLLLTMVAFAVTLDGIGMSLLARCQNISL